MGYRSVYQEKKSGKYFGLVQNYATMVNLPEFAESAHFTIKEREEMIKKLSLQYPRTEWEVVEINF